MNNEIANRIKELRKGKGYTQRALATMLNIGQTTVANYEQGIRIPDAKKLEKMADLFDVTIDYLIGRDEKNIPIQKKEISNATDINYMDRNAIEETLLEYLMAGDSKKARELVMHLHQAGTSLEYIYFHILGMVLKEVGVLWEKGLIDVWKEHYISEVIIDLMKELKFAERKKDNKPGTMIALSAGPELHTIGLRMISDLLELEGWNVTYLGSNVPVHSLIQAIKMTKADFIAITVTLEYHLDSTRNMIAAIKNELGEKSPQIIIGGSAFAHTDKACEMTKADHYGASIEDIRNALMNIRLVNPVE